jgi:thiol-disulfide isomerase/thioredoxin
LWRSAKDEHLSKVCWSAQVTAIAGRNETLLPSQKTQVRNATLYLFGVFSVGLALAALPVFANQSLDPNAVPHVSGRGRDAFQAFALAEEHRAFAIAPGGAWAWKGEEATTEAASEAALAACQEQTEQRCVLYATNGKVKFDASAWPTLWRPFKAKGEAERSRTGIRRGDRFYDLAFKSSSGKSSKLSELRGKVVLIHFWGSWCPPCRRELPELHRLQLALGARKDVRLVLLQVRENFGSAQQWIAQQKLSLPLYDALSDEPRQESLLLADGKTVGDRQLAKVFPTTYVLDKHGIVVFSHVGPVENWLQYLPFMLDAASISGK